jgi:hypothetical protein
MSVLHQDSKVNLIGTPAVRDSSATRFSGVFHVIPIFTIPGIAGFDAT